MQLTGFLLGQDEFEAQDRQRAQIGAIFGLIIGLAYGFIVATINYVVLWGIPLHFDFGSVVAGTLIAGLGMLAAGYVTARPSSSLRGIILGALLMALVETTRSFLSFEVSATQRAGSGVALIWILLPLTALFAVITTLLRLSVNGYMEALTYSGPTRLRRLLRLGGSFLLALAVIAFVSQFPQEEKDALHKVNGLIQTALAGGKLPSALQNVDSFQARAVPGYTLDMATQRSGDPSFQNENSAEQYVQVTATFDNGLVIYCLVGRTVAEPFCREPS